MNENEPKVKMPKPPAGHRWEYRGKEWSKDRATFCYLSTIARVVIRYHDAPAVGAQGHYWEAVPHPIAEENLERENAELKNVIDRESEIMGRIDHIALAAELGFTKFRENPEMFLVKVRELKARVERDEFDQSFTRHLASENAKLKAELASLKSPCVTAAEPKPAAYPPPESEWPEKPAPPEGCEWVRMPDSGMHNLGDLWLADLASGYEWRYETFPRPYSGTVVFRAEKIDHTEGGKYRMLEEGEVIEAGDEVHTGQQWEPFDPVAYGRESIRSFRRPVTPQPDFAQQAKDILQARFVTGFPAFREITLDHFVDLIIKATKHQ
jgi:hypothetical protein